MSRLNLTSPKVVAEVIDGEAIILDLRVGSYFATDGVGATVWAAAIDGWSPAEIAASAVEFYVDQPTAGADVAALLDAFVEAELLVASDVDERLTGLAIVWPAGYSMPTLEKHDDLQDMMQLDPIHDTDASGWPRPAPNGAR